MIDLQELAGGFDIHFKEVRIIQIRLDFRLTILASDDKDESLSVAIGCHFFVRADPSITDAAVDPTNMDDPVIGTIAARLRNRECIQCRIASNGTLTLGLSGNLTIEVPPNEHYEAWDVDCMQFKLLAMPGGEVAFWDRQNGRTD